MSPWLKAPDALPEDPSSILSIHTVSHNHPQLQESQHPVLASKSTGHAYVLLFCRTLANMVPKNYIKFLITTLKRLKLEYQKFKIILS